MLIDDNQLNFLELRAHIFEYHRLGKWKDALSLLEQYASQFDVPAQSASISYWQACFLCLSGQSDKALRILQEAVERGLWWSEIRLRYDDDLHSLQGSPDYETLIAECVKRHKQTDAMGATISRLVVQPSTETAAPYSCLIALHGYAGNAVTTLPDWSPLAKHGWLVVAVQSSQVADMDGFHWVDEDRARADVRQNIDELSTVFQLNADHLALVGYSNGGRAALTLALTGSVRTRYVVSVGGSLGDEKLNALDWASIRKTETPRILMIVGERDESALTRMTQQTKIFEANGLDVALQIIPEMGHSVPSDLSERVIVWLEQN